MYELVVIGCVRDLPLLKLQAESMANFLPNKTKVNLIVNEKNPRSFLKKFNTFKHFYHNLKLKIYTHEDFDFEFDDPYVDQQILKLAIAEKINNHLLVLDCQNFMIKPYVKLPIFDGKIPYRKNVDKYPMHEIIWKQYCNHIGRCKFENTHMGLATPIYLRNDICRHIISSFNGLRGFVEWFRSATDMKSEFTLYYIWTEVRLNGIEHFHYLESDPYTWADPYLRDSKTFDNDFDHFIDRLDQILKYKGYSNYPITRDFVDKCCWSSINHRSWGDMSDWQYTKVKTLLNTIGLNPKFEEYRDEYKNI